VIINGKYVENITCPSCKFRHPAELTCKEAAAAAAENWTDDKIGAGKDADPEPNDLEIAEYQFATIEYDYKVHPDAAEAIRRIFKQLYEGGNHA